MRQAGDNIIVRTGGLNISYDDYGPAYAPVVIFIHGFPFNKSMWDHQTEALKSDYRVISYDVRGYGASTGRLDYHLDRLTEDLISLMDHLKISKAALCGLSMGGNIALHAIEKYPSRFTALVLCDTLCEPSKAEHKTENLGIISSILKNGIRQFAEDKIKQYFAASSFVRNRAAVKAARQMILNTSVNTICSTLLSLEEEHGDCGDIENIRIPVLILVGREDPVVSPAQAEELHQRIPHSSVRIIEYSGHLPNLENSIDFNRVLKQFVDKVWQERRRTEAVFERR